MLTNTPDLRDKFVMGAAAPGATGGANSVTLGVPNMPGHSHGGATGAMSANNAHGHSLDATNTDHLHALNNVAGADNGQGYGHARGIGDQAFGMNNNTQWMDRNQSHGHTLGQTDINHTHPITPEGGGEAFDNRPAFYALVYIIRSELVAADVADLTALDARYSAAAHNHDGAYSPTVHGHTAIDGLAFGYSDVSCNQDGIAVLTPNVGGVVRGCVAMAQSAPGDGTGYICQATFDRSSNSPNYVQVKVIRKDGANYVGNVGMAWMAWR
jgi:hypothetical protein